MGNSGKKKNKIKKKTDNEISFSIEEVFSMMEDTSQIVVQENSARLSAMGPAASESGTLTNSVEFWSWMNRNYEKSGHFASSDSMQSYMSGTQGQKGNIAGYDNRICYLEHRFCDNARNRDMVVQV